MSGAFLSLPIAEGIPEMRARFLFRVRSEKAQPRDEQLAATQSHGVLSQKRYIELTGNKVVAALAGTENFNHVEQDDFVISLRTFEGGIERSAETGCISPAYTVLEPSPEVEPSFYQYLLKSQVFISHLQTTVTGIRDGKSVKFENFANIVLPLPDLATQEAIVDFLGRETARIDQLIKKKQRFIDVLSRKWAATITHSITNGLDAIAPRKDSGVSWIGEVPEHWNVAKLGHIGRCANGINISGDAFGSGFPFVSYGDVYRNPELPNVVDGLVQSTAEDRARYSLQKGDVLFTRTSETIDEIGFSSVCMKDMPEAVFAGFLIRFRPMKRKLIPAFSRFLFRDDRLRAFFSKEMMIVTRASLSQGLLQQMPVILPPLEEQQTIADELQRREHAFDSVSEKTKASIDRLREYRAALINAAVTGQINVMTNGKQGATDRTLYTIQEEIQS